MHFFERTVPCGLVTVQYLDKVIHLAGWVNKRRDHGGLIFIDLRDRTGLMQLVFNSEISQEAHDLAHTLRSEYIISVSGTVVKRAPETVNASLATGLLELHVTKLHIFSKSKTLPF